MSAWQSPASSPPQTDAEVGGLPAYPGARGRRRASPSAGRFHHAAEILWAGTIVALICVAGLLAIFWIQSQGAVAIVRAQAAAIREGQVERAYDLFSDDYRATMSLPMFRRWLRRQPPLGDIQNLRIWGRSVLWGTAILWGSFQDEVGHSYPVRYSLVRENGDWRIESFQVRADVPEPLPNSERFHYI
ncbi:MAG: hypothetical protein HY316_07400 [Acidobacteria bacterium]|nr:hypothetical protein [Acidobacteriota bacterium]